jgi:hypothetical protein
MIWFQKNRIGISIKINLFSNKTLPYILNVAPKYDSMRRSHRNAVSITTSQSADVREAENMLTRHSLMGA